jgi:hypothetical protein
MKIMANHVSATERKEIPHVNKSTKNNTFNLNGGSKKTISAALRRRAQAVIKDRSIDAQSRAIIRYSLETNDPWLADLVRRVDAGETIIETIVLLKHPKLTSTVRPGKRSKHCRR